MEKNLQKKMKEEVVKKKVAEELLSEAAKQIKTAIKHNNMAKVHVAQGMLEGLKKDEELSRHAGERKMKDADAGEDKVEDDAAREDKIKYDGTEEEKMEDGVVGEDRIEANGAGENGVEEDDDDEYHGTMFARVAQDYNVEKTTVGDWRRNRNEIEKWCSERVTANAVQERKTMKKCEYEKLLDKESLTGDQICLTGDQIFNYDEMGLNFKILPAKTLARKSEAATPGYKRSKERITMLACSNATANLKMKLAMIAKSKSPRPFKNVSKSALPAKYFNQKECVDEVRHFQRMVVHKFVPQADKFLQKYNVPSKVILLLDNAPSHPNEEELQDGEIKARFLPPNVTAICQPMDQDVLETLKRNRTNLLSTSVDSSYRGGDMVQTLRDQEFAVTAEEIINMVLNKKETDVKEGEVVVAESGDRISHNEGDKVLEVALKYIEQLEEISSTEVLLLQRLRDLAVVSLPEHLGAGGGICSWVTAWFWLRPTPSSVKKAAHMASGSPAGGRRGGWAFVTLSSCQQPLLTEH
ncbi:hypothetical protein PR048_004707 [Dryococelus australis]|uniref:DDE-1 domain-containing protein n=1 Tax=Dryococelus australis TaxID=614101 RepID=A0ABQ9I657_9NEOP|nr:hypothetical protein PR048_004707 [Dryococelus australis]